jgi:hypothetical protein
VTDETSPERGGRPTPSTEPEPLTQQQEAAIHDLLAALPDPVVPSEVAARITAALAAVPAETEPTGAMTVLPGGYSGSNGGAADRSGGPPGAGEGAGHRWRSSRALQAAAALVVVALVGVGAVTVLTSDEADAPATTAAPTGPALALAQKEPGPITVSRTTYSAKNLDRRVQGLLTAVTALSGDNTLQDVPRPTGAEAQGQSAPTDLQMSTSDGQAAAEEAKKQAAAEHRFERQREATTKLVNDSATRQACIDQLASVPNVQPLTIDVGRWQGKAAAVIVLADETNPTYVEAWVVGSTCSQADGVFPYSFERVPRP